MSLPEITRFYGIVIKMFFKPQELEPSHVHALYGDFLGAFDIGSGKMTVGDLPKKAQELVKEWIQAHRDDLQKMWDKQKVTKLPPLQ